MRIASLVEVTRGRLLNEPSVGAIDGFSFSSKTTKRGDCYFHYGDDASLGEAIANGAYAIVFSQNVQLRDSEIAWIVIDDTRRALASLARYLLIERNITVFSASKIAVEIARALIVDKRLSAEPKYEEAIAALSQPKPPTLLCSKTGDLIEAAINVEPLEAPPIEIVKESLFETTIVYKDRRISVAMPSLFLSEFASAIALADRFGLQTRFDRFAPINRFNVYSIANGEKLLIFDRADEAEAQDAIAFVRRVAPWAKLYIPQKKFDPSIDFTHAYLNGFEVAAAFDSMPKRDTTSLFD
jgi:hypothetical protein